MPGEGSAIRHPGVLRFFKGRWAKGGDIRLVGNAASPAAGSFQWNERNYRHACNGRLNGRLIFII